MLARCKLAILLLHWAQRDDNLAMSAAAFSSQWYYFNLRLAPGFHQSSQVITTDFCDGSIEVVIYARLTVLSWELHSCLLDSALIRKEGTLNLLVGWNQKWSMLYDLGEEGQCLAYMSPSGYNFKQFILTQAICPFKIKTQHVIL